MLITIAVDVLVDGLVVGTAFASGEQRGLLMVSAVSLEFLFLGISSAMAFRERSKPAGLGVTAVIGAVAIGGTMGGAILLSGASLDIMAGVLSFGAVAMMYLVTEELLVEAHKRAEGPWPAAVLFTGFLVYLIISQQLG